MWSIYDMVQYYAVQYDMATQIAKFMGPTRGPPGSCRPQMDPMLAPWTLLSGNAYKSNDELPKDTPYLTPTGDLWGVYCDDFEEY